MTAKLAVIGDPIAHSKSPQIHTRFAAQCGIDLTYQKIQVSVDQIEHFLNDFFAQGGRGLNITVPHKEAAYRWAGQCTAAAELAGAVNTLIAPTASSATVDVLGDNTDGAGLVHDLKRLQAPLQDARVLVLGAGGAARGAIGPLLEQRPKCLHIENRTRSKAEDLANRVGGKARPLDDDQPYDLVIGASSAGLSQASVNLPNTFVSSQTWVYDMIYADQATPLMRWAAAAGAEHCVDGLGMLVGQAAVAFQAWFNVLPETDGVLKELRLGV